MKSDLESRMQSIRDIASARLRDDRVTDQNVRHDLLEIVRLTYQTIPGVPVPPPQPPPVDRSARATLHGADPNTDDHREIDPATGMQKDYVILSDEERAKGFVRPVRRSYKHLKCGAVTSMGQKLAETYARDPSFYNGTFCAVCREHFPVGKDGEFVWVDNPDQKVGT